MAHVQSSGRIHVSCSMLEPPCCHAVQLWRIVTIYHLCSYTLRNSTNRPSAKSGVNITLWDQPEFLTNPPFTRTFTKLSFEFPSIYWNLEWGCRDVSISANLVESILETSEKGHVQTLSLLAHIGTTSWWQKTAPNHFPDKKKHACKATRDHPAQPMIRAVAHQCPKFGSKPPLWDATRCPSAWTTGRTNGGVFLLKM